MRSQPYQHIYWSPDLQALLQGMVVVLVDQPFNQLALSIHTYYFLASNPYETKITNVSKDHH